MLPIRDYLPTRATPVVNYTLIAVNLAVFALEVAGAIDPDAITARGALVPAELVAHPLASAPSLLTHMFLHGGAAHVGGNMLFLWIFGDNVEDTLGRARYAVFYLLCGLGAALAQVVVSPHATAPMIGASGAIAGVLAAYGVLYPRSKIKIVNPIVIMWLFWGLFLFFPAWLVILEFFAVNLWNALQPDSAAGGVAFMAHVGGFVAGLALLPLLRTQVAVAYDPWDRVLGPRRRQR
jgi:membrane associated rhomboid family serine protease